MVLIHPPVLSVETHFMESHHHRMVWVGSDLRDLLVTNTLPQAGTMSTEAAASGIEGLQSCIVTQIAQGIPNPYN